MNTIYILNPEGNDGNGRVTRYVGRGAGIIARIELLDALYQAHLDAQSMVEEAGMAGAEFVDISEPANKAQQVKNKLRTQAIFN